jgi:hypothetical protein
MLDRNDVNGNGATDDVALFTASTALPPFTFFIIRKFGADFEEEGDDTYANFPSGVLRHKDHLFPLLIKSVDHLFYIPSELPGPGGVTYFIEPVYIGVEDL